VRLVGESLSSVASSLAKVEGNGEGSGTRGNVDGRTTGKVEGTERTSPTVGTPGPGSDRAVDDGQPDEDKDHDGTDTCSFSETTNGEDDGDELGISLGLATWDETYSKHALVSGKYDRWESGRARGGFAIDTHKAEVF
jgi:hypothetical protein